MNNPSSQPSTSHKSSQNASYLQSLLLYSILSAASLGCGSDNKPVKNSGGDTVVVNLPDSDVTKYITAYKKEFDPQGCRYGDLYAGYLGYFTKTPKGKIGLGKTQIGTNIDVSKNPGQIIKYLWQKKFQRPQNNKFTVAKEFYDNVVSHINFANSPKSSIEEYKNDIALSIQEVKDNMDYAGYCAKKFGDDTKKAELWKKICDMVDANMILSYNMTEFFPQGAPGGKTEYRVLEHILKNYGKEFVFYVPAVSDDYTSFGSYQFTSLALYDTPEEKRGASITNAYMNPQASLPGSVVMLKGSDHHKAAYLLAMHNIYFMLRKMDPQQIQKMGVAVNDPLFKYTLPQIIAIGHNFPADINDAAAIVMRNKGGIPLYKGMAGKHTEAYARKTFQNYVAVEQGVELENCPTINLVDNVNVVDSPDKPGKIKEQLKPQKVVTKKVVPGTSTREPKEKTNHIKALPHVKVLEFVRVSNDKKYDVYSYTFQLQTGGSVGGVKNKVRQELGNKARGKTIIIVDKLGNEIKKDRHFDKGEKVRVRVGK